MLVVTFLSSLRRRPDGSARQTARRVTHGSSSSANDVRAYYPDINANPVGGGSATVFQHRLPLARWSRLMVFSEPLGTHPSLLIAPAASLSVTRNEFTESQLQEEGARLEPNGVDRGHMAEFYQTFVAGQNGPKRESHSRSEASCPPRAFAVRVS